MDVIAKTRTRVSDLTAKSVNERLASEAEARIAEAAGDPALLERRISQLDREWDVERTVECFSSVLSIAGLGLSAAVNKKWLVLPGLVQAFMLQHAIQGWCPPVPVLRRLGFRTCVEIERERSALTRLRGGRVSGA